MEASGRNIANIITLSRFACVGPLLFVPAFSPAFWALYAWCGVSDALDGFLARRLGQQSKAGARLDSLADALFLLTTAAKILPEIPIPGWAWRCAIVTALVRLVAYGIGYAKYHAFSALHTSGNKVAGLMLFLAPALYALLGGAAALAVVCAVALLSAAEELLLTLISKELDRDRKGLLFR